MSLESKRQQLADFNVKASSDNDAKKRLTALFDPDTFVEMDAFAMANDVPCGVITGYGYVDGNPVYAFAQDNSVDGGAVGRVHAEKIKKVYEMASKTGAPVVAIYDSKGARLNEGFDALAGYGDMLALSNNLSGVVPQVAVVLGTCAGVSAMLACGADFVVMSESAELFMTAPFVAKANREATEGAGTAAFAEKCGVAHLVCKDDQDALAQTRTLLSLLPINNLSMVPQFEYEEDVAGADTLLQYMAKEVCVCQAVKAIADASSVIVLQKEFGKGVFTALGTLAGSTVGFAGTKGKKLTADDSAKLARFVRTCDAFSIPVVTLVDTDGFVPSSKAELAGSIRESAKLAHAYAEATCPKIALITGDAVGSAYIALAGKGANADMVMAWPSAMISAMAPEAAVEILWHEKLAGVDKNGREQLVEEYKDTLASPLEAAKNGYIDQIFEPDQTRAYLIGALDMLSGKRVSKMPKKHGNMPL
ncbi:MAG: carboxyl transferase domain-containing protein [Clostridiales bacterium]|nr:carboxyl transferase domain-containing protein [Clostridiales bacterium]